MADSSSLDRLKFNKYYAQWKNECKKVAVSSNTDDYTKQTGFKDIVNMGSIALPFIREKMRQGDFIITKAVFEICGWNRDYFGEMRSEQELRDKVLGKSSCK